MVRTYLQFFAIFGLLALLGGIGYWFMNRDTKEAQIFVPEIERSAVPAPEPKTPIITPTPQSVMTTPVETKPAVTTDDEEDTPKPASASRQKFESEDETDDTDDSVTIEVEPEEE
ncbi:MAG: hypothetical protein ACEQSB_00895 [Undibacterium sp.]